MIRNYIVTAIRNFARHKLYSFINVAGLAVAFACAIFIGLFVRDELSYDAWVPNSQNVYRASISLFFPDQPSIVSTASPFPLGPTMQAELPEVASQTHIIPQNSTVKAGDRLFHERIDAVDPDFFGIIELPLAEGDPAHVFDRPDAIVLSQSAAKKYFGDADPLGKIVTVDTSHALIVTGVMRDLPRNTQLAGDVFISVASKACQLLQPERENWFSFNGYTYIRLVPGADPEAVRNKTQQIFIRHVDPKIVTDLHIGADKLVGATLVSFRDVHLSSDSHGGMTPGGSWTLIYGFVAVAMLIIAIAVFNFMNLATARATMRAREVSLRKVVGAQRRQLMVQFLGESVLMALIAAVLGLAAVEMLLPLYDGFLGRAIDYHYIADWPLTSGIIVLAVLAGVLGGLYPAFVLSGFRPATTLKTNASGHTGSGRLRAGLVILQFAISIGLGIAALVVFAQVRYARELALGFDRHDILIVGSGGEKAMTPSGALSFMRELDADPSIVAAAQSDFVPFEGAESRSSVTISGASQQFTVRMVDISPEFPVVYGMHLLAGRLLSRDRGNDVAPEAVSDGGTFDGENVLIDANAARMFGYTPQQALGKQIKLGSASQITIVGVIQNALFHAVREETISSVYFSNPAGFGRFSVRVKPGHLPQALSFVRDTWRRVVPTVAFQNHFLDDDFDKLFATDEQEGTIFAIFVGIAIFIAGLGLFGLAAFTAERRTKEIGIRKTFGARTSDIVRLLLWQFSIPVLIANVVAWPVAYYYLHDWLESYAYRIPLSPLYFIAVGVVALVIAWVTVLAHVLRIARANPVHALHYE